MSDNAQDIEDGSDTSYTQPDQGPSPPKNVHSPNSDDDPSKKIFASGQRPSFPFYPSESAPAGPLFLDDQSCECVLRPLPNDPKSFAWRCFGNHDISAYEGNSGKWFTTTFPDGQGKNVTALALQDSSNPPKLDQVMVAQKDHEDSQKDLDTAPLVPINDPTAFQLTVFDAACTGKNKSLYSEAYYKTSDELARNQTPIDGAPCYLQGAFPVEIVNLTTWQKTNDCRQGFYCPNNTINALPQACPPLAICANARLSGEVCALPGNSSFGIGMGPLEPIVCNPGYYCPTGKEMIKCPSGSFCPLGSFKPQKCSLGSQCPAGSRNEYMLLPLIFLIIIDIILLCVVAVLLYRARMMSHRNNRQTVLFSKTGILNERKGYGKLDETEVELEALGDPLPHSSLLGGYDAAKSYPTAASGEVDVATPELQAFVSSMRRAISGSTFGLTFEFRDLSFHPKASTNPVISEISGTIRAGSLAAIMGGSGAGKSTFFNALLGRQTHGGLVAVNGAPTKMGRLRRVMGYVPQDDIVLPELTVYENIHHSAQIRLPRSFSAAAIEEHVTAVTDCLELSHVRNSLVGSVAKPVISGGQRKRVSIGMELAAAPMALFLDEPTSGLDATSAAGLMSTLKALSKLGISVIAIIHQPRAEIFDMIDDLLLLGNGRMLYQGAARDAAAYFASMGYHIPPHVNMGDVVTDIITGNGRVYKPTGDVSKEALIAHYASTRAATAQPAALDPRASSTPTVLRASIKTRGAPFFKQFYFDLLRAILQQWRLQGSFWFEMGLASLGGLLIGLAQNSKKGAMFSGLFREEYSVLGPAADYKSAPMMALLMCVCVGLIAAAPGVRVFGDEKLVFRREAESGHSRACYYLAKTVSTLPRMLLGCLHFTVTFHLLSTPLIPWGTAFMTDLLYFWCIYGLAAVVSMVTRREDGPLLAVMASLIVAVLSGAAPPLAKVKSWHMAWLWYASPGVWAAERYFSELLVPLRYLYQIEVAEKFSGYVLERGTLDWVLLLVIGLVYRVVAFGGLIWMGRQTK